MKTKKIEWSEEELALLDAMENQPLVSVPNVEQEITQLKAAVSEKLNKRESIKNEFTY